MVKAIQLLGYKIADRQNGMLTRSEAVTLFRKDDPKFVNPFLTGDVVLCLLVGKPNLKQLKAACKGAYFTTTPAETMHAVDVFFNEYKSRHWVDYEGEAGLIKFQQLWDHVTTWNKPTPCMKAIYATFVAYFQSEPRMDAELKQRHRSRRPFLDLAKQIADEQKGVVKGKWQITNRDLEFWQNLSFFGKRDYFEGNWGWYANEVGPAIAEKRAAQVGASFTGVLPEHLALLRRCRWQMDYFRGDWVSLFVEGKRPLGNSSRLNDMFDAVDWKCTWKGDMPQHIKEKLWVLWDQLPLALKEIFSQTL